MTTDAWIALGILAIALILFVTEWLRVDVVALGVVVALVATGLLTTGEALSGFSSPVVLTIAALFVVGGAVLNTGLATQLGQRLLAIAGTGQVRLIVVIMLAVAILSAFMSDAGTVAVLLPAIVSLSVGAGTRSSKLLIPLAFGSLLGGALTLIGTPPNLLVSGLLRDQGLQPFGFFDYTPIAAILLVAGIAFMAIVGRHLLPDYQPQQEVQRVETPQELVDLYRLPDSLFRLRVRRGSGLIGRTVTQARLGRDFQISVVEVLRPTRPRSVLQLGELQSPAKSETWGHVSEGDAPLAVDDVLIVGGNGADVSHAAAFWNLGLQPARAGTEEALITQEVGIAEVLLPPRSSLVGKTLVETQFGTLHKLTVLGINRPGIGDELDLKTTRLRFGDVLLVQGPWDHILALRKRRRDFVVMGEPEAVIGAPARRKAPIALLILAGLMVLLLTNVISVAAASLAAALAVVLAGCLTMDEAYQSVDWRSVVLIAGMIPMSIALEKIGLVNVVAEGMVNALGDWGPVAVLAGLFLVTSVLTQILSNTATTVLIAPIALAAAQKLAIQPYAFLMAVAIAASMAFASPVASPVNTLVMGAGNYRFADYARVGVPLLLVALIVSILLLPLLWPLSGVIP
jgi:di/tricarboxylate transporter